ncbi:sentrin-specific protease 1 [Denticeps clupeoides]|uniref:Ubiquitin-like protease family profile domain-containing protein n=1 Tax=Denticeps clupeoides TaxID=299321 RepID=A0AAY4BZI4_9TELE|nr:sentrin-specific protease 1-like [Denticeps clupeoides]
MFNKLYEWIGSGIANLRNGAPAGDVQRDRVLRRKRTADCLDDGGTEVEEDRRAKKFRMGDLVDGVKTHGSSVASWVRSNVSPGLRGILPPTPPAVAAGAAPPDPPWRDGEDKRAVPLHGTFVAPSTTTLEWKTTSKSDFLRTERSVTISKFCKHQTHAAQPNREAPKTNGHSVTVSSCPSPRLGRSLNFRPRGPRSASATPGLARASCSLAGMSMYEKTFPIRVVQSPSHGSSGRLGRGQARCTAQESVREEEKEVYRQLLAMVSGGQSLLFHHGASHAGLRSHRDFTSFLSSSRRRLLRRSPSPGSGAAESLEMDSGSAPPSPRPASSQASSPGGGEGRTWTPEPEREPTAKGPAASAPSPAAVQDSSSLDTQSSAQDGDSVIFVDAQQGERSPASSVPSFQAELWIKELTSLYDSRARERRRLIEEQEALTSRLLRQRLSEEGRAGVTTVELRVRVPLEKEVPLAPVRAETKPAEEQEFPELSKDMEMAVSAAFKGGGQDEVLSEGFRLTITRKDLQTLSNLNWLNDEVINFYMNLLMERSKQPGLPSVYTFNTFFFPKLRSAGYSAVRRWTKKVDLFSHDIVLVPVHLGVHWCLSVVDFRKPSITYFDSMGGNNDEACRILLNYLKQESKDKRKKELDASGWTLHSKKRNEIPQQMNGSDCGMFTCKYAEYVTKDRPITFTQKHMPYFRRRMVWEILNRKLL